MHTLKSRKKDNKKKEKIGIGRVYEKERQKNGRNKESTQSKRKREIDME